MTLAIVGIIILGLLLLVVEFFLFPGTTLIGIGGMIILGIGIIMAFSTLGQNAGIGTLIFSTVAGGLLFIFGYKTISSGKMALDKELDGRVNELNHVQFEAGTEGYAYTDLRPWGKAFINGQKYEVQSVASYIERNTPIVVHKIEINKILVKPLVTVKEQA